VKYISRTRDDFQYAIVSSIDYNSNTHQDGQTFLFRHLRMYLDIVSVRGRLPRLRSTIKGKGPVGLFVFLFFPLYLKLTGNKYRIRHAHVYEGKDGNVERKFDDGKLLSFSPSSFYCFQIPKCTYIHASLLNSPR